MRDSSLQPPRGARDFYPDEFRRRAWLFARFRSVARAFAFEEIDAPVLEHADLFIRKAGEEIVDQLYHFELHDRHLALRPEMTPQLARMVLSRAGGMAFPIRWSSVTQNWRYERMTRGRLREHYQWNMDIWGEADVTAEAELIAAIFTLLGSVGLPMDAVHVRVNSRALLETALRKGVLAKRPEAFEPLCVIIDKLPFAPPSDPITAARMEAIAKLGGNPFDEYQVPLAILALLQGLGRLIRHRQDRGVLSILDPRILTKGYGRRFLASLPPTPIVRTIGQVEQFLARKGV